MVMMMMGINSQIITENVSERRSTGHELNYSRSWQSFPTLPSLRVTKDSNHHHHRVLLFYIRYHSLGLINEGYRNLIWFLGL